MAPLLAACASFQSLTPGMPAQQVQARVGAPADVRKSGDGSEVWEYPLGPMGRQTYMVTLGPDHSLREVRQVLSEEYFSRVENGMPREEVRGLLGRPYQIVNFARRDEEVWTWRYQTANPMLFHVFFDRSSGTVKATQKLEEIIFMDDSD
jgi:hypothetical protein